MRQKIIAGVLALTLTSFAAVGAFASQDGGHGFKDLLSGGVLGVDSTPTETATATTTATDTATAQATDTATATETAEATATETPDATDTTTASATGTPTGDDEREIKGIPTSNPSHEPDNGDGQCDRGETDVKTTPSGTQVNVPCQAAGDGEEHGNNGDHESGTPTAATTPAATATP